MTLLRSLFFVFFAGCLSTSIALAHAQEPQLHKAIINGDLEDFRRNLNEASILAYSPAAMDPVTRIFTADVQNRVSASVRATMYNELKSHPDFKKGVGTNAHLLVYAPPEVFRSFIDSDLERTGTLSEFDATTNMRFAMDITESEYLSPRVHETTLDLYCNGLGYSLIALLQSRSGTTAFSESQQNLDYTLSRLISNSTPSKGSSHSELLEALKYGQNYIDNSPEPKFSFTDNVCTSFYIAENLSSIHDVFAYFGSVYGSYDSSAAALEILKKHGVFLQKEYDRSKDNMSEAFQFVASRNRADIVKRTIKESIRPHRNEPEIHKAIMFGDLSGVRANINQVNMTGYMPAGITTLQRALSSDVQNIMTPAQHEELVGIINSTIRDELVASDRYIALHAAYGSFGTFNQALRQVQIWREQAKDGSHLKLVDDGIRLLTPQLGQESFDKFGSTPHRCPLIMHVYQSIMDAPADSVQLEQALLKFEFLLRGRWSLLEGANTKPDPGSEYFSSLMQTCSYVERALDQNMQIWYNKTVFAPNIYTSLAGDLTNPRQKKRAMMVLTAMESAGRYDQDEADRSIANAQSLAEDVAEYRAQVAEAKAQYEARKSFDEAMSRQSVIDGILGGLSAAANDINRQVYNSPDARRARAAERASEIARQNLVRARLNSDVPRLVLTTSLTAYEYGTDDVVAAESIIADVQPETGRQTAPTEIEKYKESTCGYSADEWAAMAADTKPGYGATCN